MDVPTAGGDMTGGPTEATTATENSSAASGAASDGGFTGDPDMPGECDPWQQDCPEGQKCAPWADDGGAWNAVKCVPVTGDGRPGEPCTAEGNGVSGRDDCEEGAMCWEVGAELHGHCVALCVGSAKMPACADEDTSCSVLNEGVLPICLPDCDLLLQDCPGDDLCLPIDNAALCVLDAGRAGATFDPCYFANDCDEGLICVASASAVECDAMRESCCLPMCDLNDMDYICPGAGQSCVPLFAEGEAPPKLANVGYCALPE